MGDNFGSYEWLPSGRGIKGEMGDSLIVISFDPENGFQRTGPPELVQLIPGLRHTATTRSGDIYYTRGVDLGDGEEIDESTEIVINVIVNWFEELERIAPTGRR